MRNAHNYNTDALRQGNGGPMIGATYMNTKAQQVTKKDNFQLNGLIPYVPSQTIKNPLDMINTNYEQYSSLDEVEEEQEAEDLSIENLIDPIQMNENAHYISEVLLLHH